MIFKLIYKSFFAQEYLSLKVIPGGAFLYSFAYKLTVALLRLFLVAAKQLQYPPYG